MKTGRSIGGRRRMLWPGRAAAAVLMLVAAVTVAASPASAAPGWQTYTITEWWACGPSAEVEASLFIRACTVTNANWDAQPVALVSNYTGLTKKVQGRDVDLFVDDLDKDEDADFGWDGGCPAEDIPSGTSRACFGETRTEADWPFTCGVDQVRANAKIIFNGTATYGTQSPWSPFC